MIRFRILFPVMAALTVLIFLTPLLLGLVIAVLSYHGTCYGFTDGSWACTWEQYLSDQISWSTVLDFPLGMFVLPCWLAALGLWWYRRGSSAPEGLTAAAVLLIPLGGCLGGFCLLSIIPMIMRLVYRF